ncbi:MAG TPA: hypothetical protein VN732_05225, partial [Solirubrobacterales bacterium]|nr:hypothetical protein [Solirubrobacterales bacterium]
MAFASPAAAAGPPTLGATWVGEVTAASARLHGTVTPNGAFTRYRFDYIPQAAYEANLAAGSDAFAGAKQAPAAEEPPVGSGATAAPVAQLVVGLASETAYRYRIVARNSAGTVASSAFRFVTAGAGGGVLLDNRGWEMVSPVDKNGGAVAAPESIAGGGVLQAAADGERVTYSSSASFGSAAQGAPPGSQYLASRGSGGWSSQNINVPTLSGSYGADPEGVPYQLFAPDLARGLLLNGEHCRGEATSCPVANPPLTGTGAPAGYQNYYLRETAAGAFRAVLTEANDSFLALGPEDFDLSFAGASPDLRFAVFSTCARLTVAATEVPGSAGCDPEAQNLYLYAEGQLRLINLLPGQTTGTPGARLAAQRGAVSADGNRVYFEQGGNLYLREGNLTRQVDEAVGGVGTFETATPTGLFAFFTKGGHLYRYRAAPPAAVDLTPSGGVAGVLGASDSGARVYYQDATALQLWHEGTTTVVAPGAEAAAPGNYPPTTGRARVTADGGHLAFVSTESLTGYDNVDQETGDRDLEVYRYELGGGLRCVSCNPTEARPIGAASIPGASANGDGPTATRSYKPRSLSADGRRVFFESSDALVPTDSNHATDVYEWEAQGTGTCARSGGCVALISSGRGQGGARFADASADGSSVFFLTGESLVAADPGAVDLYVAREGGGFPVAPEPIPCEGDACQPLPGEPFDPAVGTLVAGPGNPPVRYQKRCRKGTIKR